MIKINYNAQTGEETIEEVADVETPIIDVVAEPTEAERIEALESAILELGGLIGG